MLVGLRQEHQPQQQLGMYQSNYSSSRKKGNSVTIIGVVTIIIAILFAVNWKSNLAFSRTIPNIAGQYNGTNHNRLDPNKSVIRRMTVSIKQNQGNISGDFKVESGLRGSGPLTGTVDDSGNVKFIVHSNEIAEALSFWGTEQSDASLSGSYCSLKQNQCDPTWGHGTWKVSQSVSIKSILKLQT